MLDKAKDIAELLKVISNENRLLIVCLLIEKPMNVSELHENLKHLTQSALSQHLSMLKAHKILEANKNGLTITYSIYDGRIIKLMEAIKKNYCN